LGGSLDRGGRYLVLREASFASAEGGADDWDRGECGCFDWLLGPISGLRRPVGFSSYYQIAYPGGDLPKSGDNKQRGKAEDVIIRSYRHLGIDLQVLIHEDMTRNFSSYPQLWGSRAPDANIDHRRIQNLQRYFKHVGAELPATRTKEDYKPGDVVVWMMAQGELHCGIVVPGPGERRDEAWVVHDNGEGPKWENVLTEFQIHGHYRFTGQALEVAKR
jgi:uncharacterized protein YijF (DUF1287 family)